MSDTNFTLGVDRHVARDRQLNIGWPERAGGARF